MNLDTIQNALKDLYVGFGGDIQDVRYLDEINEIIEAIAALNINSDISGIKAQIAVINEAIQSITNAQIDALFANED